MVTNDVIRFIKDKLTPKADVIDEDIKFMRYIHDIDIEKRQQRLDRILNKEDWNITAREYIDIMRLNNDIINNYGNKEKVKYQLAGIREIVDDASRKYMLHIIGSGNEKIFEFSTKDETFDSVLEQISTDVHEALFSIESNFKNAFYKMMRDWIDVGLGCLMMVSGRDDGFFFNAVNPLNISFGLDEFEAPNEFIIKYSDFVNDGKGEINTEYCYRYFVRREYRKNEQKWIQCDFMKHDGNWRIKDDDFRVINYQPVMLFYNNVSSGATLGYGKGVSLITDIKEVNNILNDVSEIAKGKMNKIIMVPKGMLDDRNDLSMAKTLNGIRVYEIEPEIYSGGVSVFDNNSDPQMAMWLLDYKINLIRNEFDINRLMTMKSTTIMTATEASLRDKYDSSLIDLATIGIKELIYSIVFSYYRIMHRKYDGLKGLKTTDVKIVWKTYDAKGAAQQRLAEVSGTIDIIAKLLQFEQMQKQIGADIIDINELIKAISKVMSFRSVQSSQTPADSGSNILRILSQANEEGANEE